MRSLVELKMCIPSSRTIHRDEWPVPFSPLARNFNSDFLSCDCGLRWVPAFFRTSSARLGDETLCAYPRSLRGKPLRGLRENQLNCGEILPCKLAAYEWGGSPLSEKSAAFRMTQTVYSQTHYLNMLPPSGVFFSFSESRSMRATRERFPSPWLRGGHISQSSSGLLTANPVVCLYELMQSASNMAETAGA